MNDLSNTPLESPLETATMRRRISIGLPRSCNESERRFPLTPEAVSNLTERGFAVMMEEGAAEHIHYTDAVFQRAGAHVTTRTETLGCDIVIHLAPLEVNDICRLRRGALLLSFSNFNRRNAPEVVRSLLERKVINIAIDLIRDEAGNRPFADILEEISGRAAVTAAAAMLADPDRNKGILLGGVAGVVPCEVMVIGSDFAACAAAGSATGLGALVRMFDSDVYRLRSALRSLGNNVIGSSIHPHSLENALHTADVVIATDLSCPVVVESSAESIMKKGVIIFDLSSKPGKAFPGMPAVDLGVSGNNRPTKGRVCYVNAGNLVPRTAAMALGDTFITLLDEIAGCSGASRAIQLTSGLQQAALTFLGKAVNPTVAKMAGVRHTDIRFLLSLS